MYDEILSSIDNIDTITMEAEMNVLNALFDEYDKAIMIMENYNGNDYSSFDIFMEADGEESDVEEIDTSNYKGRRNSILGKIMQVFKNIIAKISLKVTSYRFDKVIKDIEKYPNNTEFTNNSITYKHPMRDLYDILNTTLEYIESVYSVYVEDEGGKFNVSTSDMSKTIDELTQLKKEIRHINETKPLTDQSEKTRYLQSELLAMAKKEKESLAGYTGKINKMLKNMNKAFKNMKFSEETPNDIIRYYRKMTNEVVDCYILIIDAIMMRIDGMMPGVRFRLINLPKKKGLI